jgi:solute carrier family 44 protein 1 (choline transporter-like protein)
VPSIIFEPILTFVALIFAIGLFILFAVLIETSGRLTGGTALDNKPQAQYVKDFGMILAHIINLIAFIWFAQFIFGCQHFVIAGTISKWYFTRDKTKLNAPVTTSFSNLVRFHLGSVCLGSMILTLVKIIKMIVEGIKQQARESGNAFAQALACCCSWIIDSIDELLQYLFRNAYIIVAKDGTPFFESGKRAFGLLFRNLMDVIALNNFGDIVLNLARIFVVVICGFIGYELMVIYLSIFVFFLNLKILLFLAQARSIKCSRTIVVGNHLFVLHCSLFHHCV